MSNLLEEYRKRHCIECIWPVNEGVLFFNQNDRPAAIALTSSFTKSLNVCPACPMNSDDGITLEIFRVYRWPYCIQRVTHTHMPPDADLIDYVHNHVPNGEEFEPYISKGERDQERWIWNFFLESNPFKGYKPWGKFMKYQKTNGKTPELAWLEQAFWSISNRPDQFRIFYNVVYSVCMVNRRYILTN